jgi:hypothetical protein
MTIRITGTERVGTTLNVTFEYDYNATYVRQLMMQLSLNTLLEEADKVAAFITIVRGWVAADRLAIEAVLNFIQTEIPSSFEES